MHARTVSVLFLSFLFACGRDQSSGAASTADTGQTMIPDTSSAAAPLDSGPSGSAPDSAEARADTAPTVTRQPIAKKPLPKPPAPKPAAPKPAAPAQVESPDTSTAAVSAPSDTAAAGAATPAPTAEASAPMRDQYHPAPRDTVSQEVYDGWKQYNLNCARCHGEDVQGTTIAPHLIVSLKPDGPIKTKELFVQTVCAGRPEKGMPAWCPLGMDMPKIEAIYAYVKGRSAAEIHPGRPALRQGG
jgi:mono/diheme cytochrome c family protein